MREKNITSRQFAEEIGIQPSNLSHILNGRNKPSLDFVMKIVQRWPDININWLMFGKDEMLVGPSTPSGPVAVDPSVGEPDLFSIFPSEEPEPSFVAPAPVPVPEPLHPAPEPEPEPLRPVPTPEPEPVPSDPVPVQEPEPVPEPLPEPQKPQPVENRLFESVPASAPVQPIPGRRRLVKVIMFYSNHTCEEFIPQE